MLPEAPAIVLLVVDPGRGIEAREVSGAEKDIPEREDGGEVAGLVVVQGVVGAVKERTDEETISEAAEAHADVGVSQAFEGSGGEGDD